MTNHPRGFYDTAAPDSKNRGSERSEDVFCEAEPRLAKQGLHISGADMTLKYFLSASRLGLRPVLPEMHLPY